MENFLLGVNFHGWGYASYQNRSVTPKPPNGYINDSFKIFKEAGIQCIRFPLYWESYEKNPEVLTRNLIIFLQQLGNMTYYAYTITTSGNARLTLAREVVFQIRS
jgi:hypothetical protein